MIRGSININGNIYNWMETRNNYNRGILFNPGNREYRISPNPHEDGWYHHNQDKFYDDMITGLQNRGNAHHWGAVNTWPNSINNISVNHKNYTLEG